ncbi:MAG: hypothetical protein IJ660_02865 [Alphaproteobacteria bacterium]|nr:hypothetical protein [Alphaproteobacteria bacterium]
MNILKQCLTSASVVTVILSCHSTIAAAANCTSIPSCTELGYTDNSCTNGKALKCPFDQTKMFCISSTTNTTNTSTTNTTKTSTTNTSSNDDYTPSNPSSQTRSDDSTNDSTGGNKADCFTVGNFYCGDGMCSKTIAGCGQATPAKGVVFKVSGTSKSYVINATSSSSYKWSEAFKSYDHHYLCNGDEYCGVSEMADCLLVKSKLSQLGMNLASKNWSYSGNSYFCNGTSCQTEGSQSTETAGYICTKRIY